MKNDYFTVDGNGIRSVGITIGATLPVYNEIAHSYSGFTVGMEIGSRGSIKNNLVRENYINFSFGVNLNDRWFQKRQYY